MNRKDLDKLDPELKKLIQLVWDYREDGHCQASMYKNEIFSAVLDWVEQEEFNET